MSASHAAIAAGARLIHVVQGEYRLSSDPEVVLTTILGSCVAACLRDGVAGVGGMNHFLLPGDANTDADSLNYGVNSMELLINGLLQSGATRDRLEAKLFGGACVVQGLSSDVGAKNSEFALQFLQAERIRCVSHSLGGVQARRIRYWPVSGRAAMHQMAASGPVLFETERAHKPAAGAVELF